MSEQAAVEALERLGLTNYEAKTFIALHRLGTGSAREVADVADVPRSQVYSTADSLADRGLIEVQQSDPIRYRPVAIEEAKAILRGRFERTQETAFEHVERVRTDDPEGEEREDVWTITGRETIDARIAHLVGEADHEVLFGTGSAASVRRDTAAALRRATSDGVSVTVISRDPAMNDRFEDDEGITVVLPAIEEPDGAAGRLLVVDEDTVLLSVFGEGTAGGPTETALWSHDTRFARVLVRLVRGYLRA